MYFLLLAPSQSCGRFTWVSFQEVNQKNSRSVSTSSYIIRAPLSRIYMSCWPRRTTSHLLLCLVTNERSQFLQRRSDPLPRRKLALRHNFCLLYTSDAADERSSVDLGG